MLEKILADKKSHIFEIDIDETASKLEDIKNSPELIKISHELLFNLSEPEVYIIKSKYDYMYNSEEEKTKYLKDTNDNIIVDKKDFKTLNSTLNLVIDTIFKIKGYSNSEVGDVKKITQMKIYYYAASFIKEGYEDIEVYNSLNKSCSEVYSSLEKEESKKIVQEFIPKEFLEYVNK